ncbi:hypothetical protein L1987_59624 [Smallanthus sonchifolius]|uniref:Uncharacterized protein n=1 Tax=Smallanthus sonchifolius TaxID=185202 RepID=A0ACB9D5Z8_9ASTR|nr:hypothetical protein L1987_59624 [Smallanthus sonchifolius]
MVRAPCCERMGLKKGPWTREEDQILINYVNMHGHDNWRALPKLAGLLTIANQWSAIAAQLPGRTDNEIKNVWHTHLKKRLNKSENQYRVSKLKEEDIEASPSSSTSKLSEMNSGGQTSSSQLNSPQHSYSEISSVITINKGDMQVLENLEKVDDDFWSEIFSGEFTEVEGGYKHNSSMHDDMQFWFYALTRGDEIL